MSNNSSPYSLHTFEYDKCDPGTLDVYTSTFIYNKFRVSDTLDYLGYVDRDIEYLINKEKVNV